MSPDGNDVLSSSNDVNSVEDYWTTKNDGKVGPFHLRVDKEKVKELNLNDSSKLPLRVTFSKFSNGGEDNSIIPHTFLCNDESIVCPDSGLLVYLSHLDFNKVIHVADATTVLMTGRVYSGKLDENGEITSSGCTVSGVEVALYRKIGNDQEMKVYNAFTDDLGLYSLKANIGTWVYPKVIMNGRKFDPMDDSKGAIYTEKGFFASSEAVQTGDFSDHDFFDTTLAQLHVEVAGGLCDIRLGQWYCYVVKFSETTVTFFISLFLRKRHY